MVKWLILFFLASCISSENTLSIKANSVSQKDNSDNSNNSDNTNNQDNSSNDSDTNNVSENYSITITPQNGASGSSINLESNIKKLVTVLNSGSISVEGVLSISGSNDLELVTVLNCQYNNQNISYNLNPGESAKFMVVKKSNFSQVISASLVNSINGTSNYVDISASALGYSFIHWFSPKDISFSDLASDVDMDGSVSNGDTIMTLPDRSGNNFHLVATDTNYGTIVTAGNNNQRNILVNTNSIYGDTFSNLGLPSSGEPLTFMLSYHLTEINNTVQYSYTTLLPGTDYNTYYGARLNTVVPVKTGKCGTYANKNAFEVTTNTPSTPHIFTLHFKNTTIGNSISNNMEFYFNNDLQPLNTTNNYTGGGNQFSSSLADGTRIQVRYGATLHDIMIVKGLNTDEKRLDLICYQALKYGHSIAECY